MLRFRRLPRRVRPYLVRTVCDLLIARLALRALPFMWLTRLFELPPKRPEATYAERKRISSSSPERYPMRIDGITDDERKHLQRRVRRLVELAAFFLPGETACFARAIAAQASLRRLGVGTTLYYGATTRCEDGLTAHVWLQDGNVIIVGHHEAGKYRVLAHYPEDGQS